MKKNRSTIILISDLSRGSIRDVISHRQRLCQPAPPVPRCWPATRRDGRTRCRTRTIPAYFEAADAYNQRLAATPNSFFTPEQVSGYDETLDVSGTGIMGYITIPRIGVELPVYHGTSDGVLQVAAGHLEGSSLPVGGAGTHAVISAHRGLPSAKLFTNLDELEAGDTLHHHGAGPGADL